jgi:hypothetical protein
MNNLMEAIDNAEFGSISAQLNLVKYYLSDECFDYDKAEKWLNRLLDNNSLFATYELFNLYNNGRNRDGIISEYSHNKAVDLLKLAAEKNHIEALFQLGIKELHEEETKPNGVELIIDASLAGHLYAKELLEKYDWELPYALELAAAGDLYNEAAENFSLKARDLYFKIEISNQGDSTYIHSLGDFYNNLEMYDEAAIWYKKASDLGNDDARFNLALLHHDEKINNSNLDEALRLLESLVKKSDFDAIHIAGRIFLIRKLYYRAVAYFRAAALVASTNELKVRELEYANKFKAKISSSEEMEESERIYAHLVRIITK